ncbi:MAG TPA: universal stress protein [Methylomirabilota bacterium]|nr:universal stress protein [Methylomirabilota bacterium]
MPHKILIALDGSAGAWRAVEYVADVFGQTRGIQVTLLHVQPGLPGEVWSCDRVLSEPHRERLRTALAQWERTQQERWQILIRRAQRCLVQAGVPKTAISERFRRKDYRVADTIAEEAERGHFTTIVMGRRASNRATSQVLGSVSNRVIQAVRGCAVTIVD